MGKRDKKKGKGAEKTAMKTEKKALNKIKKDMAAKGEIDIEKLIKEFQEQDRKIPDLGEVPCSQPSPRSSFSLCPHPDKEELVLFGGEYWDGRQTTMFNDLYFYNIKKGQWSMLQTPIKPPPRCAQQTAVVSQRGGELWLFGGEFSSPQRTIFHHYKDLWVYHFQEKKWEEVKAPHGPSPRSGHRMLVMKKQLVIFGGFHQTVHDYKYYNDLYTFDLEEFKWSKIDALGKVPSFRSGFVFAPVSDGRILLYGGYSIEKMKKDIEKGTSYTDMYYLHVDEKSDRPKWKWVQAKPTGIVPSPRSSLSIAVAPNNQAFIFGGVEDLEEEDDTLESVFYNELYVIDLEKGRFSLVTLRGKDAKVVKKRRRRGGDDEDEKVHDESEVMAEGLKQATLSDAKEVIVKDDVFTVKIGSSLPVSSNSECGASAAAVSVNETFIPKGRICGTMVVKNGILYLYGGLYEEGKRRCTLSDFYSLDIHKLDEWRTIVPFSTSNMDFVESESESSDSDNSTGLSQSSSDDDSDCDDDEDADDEGMDAD